MLEIVSLLKIGSFAVPSAERGHRTYMGRRESKTDCISEGCDEEVSSNPL
jgi:hypothetical protein